ncbi:hypothetical protein HanHA300_Chr04g0140481 [Helianthus annuus]|uniref:myosin-9-like isoform X3 n=1 Tax=Helianthus annuus TaxID=4232 RepID=UPI000B902014|nr:myosin-9-like isoform X3 [Helianthus annuus]KAJ0581391.1 hypothetical protein HanHA300_Chr04g0140481 [Helianthus annuus]KAJ0597337.1 hypothetical protein HanHA89_Chr04g0153441 [Helianthus annuus]
MSSSTLDKLLGSWLFLGSQRLYEISHDLCPVLSIRQLYRISTMYWDDKCATCSSISSKVILDMQNLMSKDTINGFTGPFLLDDDLSVPFSADDLSKSMDQINIADIEDAAC